MERELAMSFQGLGTISCIKKKEPDTKSATNAFPTLRWPKSRAMITINKQTAPRAKPDKKCKGGDREIITVGTY